MFFPGAQAASGSPGARFSVQRSQSCERLIKRCSHECEHGTQECVRYDAECVRHS
jgi:hypothetical protein